MIYYLFVEKDQLDLVHTTMLEYPIDGVKCTIGYSELLPTHLTLTSDSLADKAMKGNVKQFLINIGYNKKFNLLKPLSFHDPLIDFELVPELK